MIRVEHFVKESEIRKYRIQGFDVDIEVNEHIFPPSPHGSFFAENINVNEGESVIDIGSGSGILAIIAAKMGGEVVATDTDKHAVELTSKNAEKNGVSIDARQGEYFGDFNRKFDVIIANLPQEIIPDNYREAIGDALAATLDGGPEGNQSVLEFLDLLKEHIHEKTRIYLIVYSATFFHKTLQKIRQNFQSRLIATGNGSTKEFVEDNLQLYADLNQQGLIEIFQEGDKWKAHEFIYELRQSV